ncbi:ATP-dependent acyl-CoA ligase [Streptomyces sp. HC44]|uniref:ATP-dependent acyl-CoA ligase n=1 Tax=Streptomyces scabichelini TaxID=2711217 RepID=A0A6G4VBT3_9ACTN|nr:AMP-binding protein [Streptomyces scabichelini]NGO11582.1 ATP-dependent acyl-CoA ligase [Streptomyces scabichelini]
MTEILAMDDPRVPDAASCTVGGLLAARAAEHPDRVFAVFADGSSWTYRETYERSLGAAAVLATRGVRPGDRVVSWLPNGPEALLAWFGSNLAGAVHTPVNTAFRGRVLEHVLTNAGPGVIVAHPELGPRLDEIDPGDVRPTVIGPGQLHGLPGGFEPVAAQPWDTFGIIYTSGTTGPSKGVLCSYVHHYSACVAAFAGRLGEEDRYLVQLPLFHAGGTLGVYAALLLGSSVAVVDSFATEKFWNVVRTHRITCCTLLGVMASFLLKRPASAADTGHPLKWVWLIPLGDDGTELAGRFGIDVHTLFNMTETSVPLVSGPAPKASGLCGRPRPGVEIRVVDAHDRQVPCGEVGELVLRADRPWSLSHGYHGMPEATAAAWRNGWFHTGDAVRQDAEGQVYFVDRMKDAIRRRGENISSFEVEAEAMTHPAVREAAAVAVPSEHGEDEVLLAVAPVPGRTVDPAEVITYLIPRMAHFMVPRFVRVLAELPKTPTSKVRKHLLRTEGVVAGTWDRQAAGLEVKRASLGRSRLP